MSAAIIASHSYPSSLSGCPFNSFLQTVIAELNPFQDYVTYDDIKDIPCVYTEVKVGLLSPANSNWKENNESFLMLQNKSIALGTFHWSRNAERNDGVYPLHMNTMPLLKGSFEAYCV